MRPNLLLRHSSEAGGFRKFCGCTAKRRWNSRTDIFNHQSKQAVFPISTSYHRLAFSTEVTTTEEPPNKNLSQFSAYEHALSDLPEGSQLHLDFYGEPGKFCYSFCILKESI